nr:phosphohydrolase [Chloroflexia bacterium]
PAMVAHVSEIVATLSFKGVGVSTPMRTLEGAIVQDADRLDALGAIGIARTFAYGGFTGAPMHDPDVPPRTHDTFDAYKANRGTVINHFPEKLLHLRDRMNTPTARRLAADRHRFLETFLTQFFAEWDGTL